MFEEYYDPETHTFFDCWELTENGANIMLNFPDDMLEDYNRNYKGSEVENDVKFLNLLIFYILRKLQSYENFDDSEENFKNSMKKFIIELDLFTPEHITKLFNCRDSFRGHFTIFNRIRKCFVGLQIKSTMN